MTEYWQFVGATVDDLLIHLDNHPGALATMGEALGAAGISIEGGGVFVDEGTAVAHFLFSDGEAARIVLEAAGIRIGARRKALVQRLDQETPGQLGTIARAMSNAGVNIEVMYSDHRNQLILVVDDPPAGREVSRRWTARQQATRRGIAP
jgi:hypothetical protein